MLDVEEEKRERSGASVCMTKQRLAAANDLSSASPSSLVFPSSSSLRFKYLFVVVKIIRNDRDTPQWVTGSHHVLGECKKTLSTWESIN